MNDVIYQKITIPTGWKVEFNSFYDIEPIVPEMIWEKNQAYFNEDMLQLKNEKSGVLIDLGWYPSGAITGQFILKVVQTTKNAEAMPASWDKPLEEFRTRNKGEVATTIEEWLVKYNPQIFGDHSVK